MLSKKVDQKKIDGWNMSFASGGCSYSKSQWVKFLSDPNKEFPNTSVLKENIFDRRTFLINKK